MFLFHGHDVALNADETAVCNFCQSFGCLCFSLLNLSDFQCLILIPDKDINTIKVGCGIKIVLY